MSVDQLLSGHVTDDPERATVSVSLADGDDVLDALASETARRVLLLLGESPRTTSELADEAGLSIQATTYHLDRLHATGLIKVVGTKYSSKARAMDVYAAISDSIRIRIGVTE